MKQTEKLLLATTVPLMTVDDDATTADIKLQIAEPTKGNFYLRM
jgi:hypothetical protein